MASYKDPSNLKFNPYVQQRPVEAMMKVGMYKQQLYNEGVQKIQQSIDNVAGLDVVRGVDKKYLESKLNQLGSNLTNVAGGDFSNFQLVNSVNGMTNQIVKDPNIINAVSSASKYRKELEFQNKLRQEGKSSEANDYVFNLDSSKWLNSEDINESYNVKYAPYTDVNKASQDVIKGLAKEYTENDVAFDYDSNGNIVGVRDVITRQKIEGISPERIQAALKTSLSPNAWRQLSIDGIYKYSNVSPEGFVNDLNNSYNKTFTQLTKERERLQSLASSTNDPKYKKDILSKIKQLDQNINATRTEYDSLSRGFANGDVESAKAQLYTMNWMENTANAFSSFSSSQKLEKSPYFSIQMDKANLQLAQERLREQKRSNSVREQIDLLKLDELRKGNQGFGNISLPVSKEATAVEVITQTELRIEKQNSEVNTAKEAFKNKYNVTDEGYDELMAQLDKGTSGMRPDQVKDLSAIKSLDKTVTNLERNYVRAHSEAEELYPDKINEVIKDLGNKALVINEGDTIYQYDYATAANLFDSFEKYKRSTKPGMTASPVDTQSRYYDTKASQELNSSDYKLYQLWKNNGFGFGSETSKMYQDVLGVKDKIVSYNKKLDEDRNDYVKNYIQNSYIIPQQVGVSIDKDKIPAFRNIVDQIAEVADMVDGLPNFDGSAEEIKSINSNLDIANIYTDSAGQYNIKITDKEGTSLNIPIPEEIYQSFGGRFEPSPAVTEFNRLYLPSMLSTPRDIVYKVDQSRLNNEINGLQNNGVIITNELYKEIENKYSVPTKAPASFFTTSIDGKYETNKENAGLSGIVDFPSTSYYGISGNIVSDQKPNEAETFSLQLNIYDPIEKEWYENVQFPLDNIDKTKIVPTIRQINDEVIWGLLNNTNKKMPDSEMKKLQESVKNRE